jgi:hypothetical protein
MPLFNRFFSSEFACSIPAMNPGTSAFHFIIVMLATRSF